MKKLAILFFAIILIASAITSTAARLVNKTSNETAAVVAEVMK